MAKRIVLTLLLIIATSTFFKVEATMLEVPRDTTALVLNPDTIDRNRNWIHLIMKGDYNLQDPTVEYPRFVGFCVKTYNWFDQLINSYDSLYVSETDKYWKARLLFDSWVDSYYLNPGGDMPITMISDIYANAGAYIQFMAVSAGYSIDLPNIIHAKPINHRKFEFGLSAARFNLEAHYWENTGGTNINKFGKYNQGRFIDIPFNGTTQKTIGLSGFYIFNNHKFSLGAGYNFSKFQNISQGSVLLGLNYNNVDITMNLKELPAELKNYLTIAPMDYKFHYRLLALMGGYSYNWVLSRKWLFNITALPGIGIAHTFKDNVNEDTKLLAYSGKAMGSLTYNNRNFFLSLIGKFDGNLYKSPGIYFLSSIENLQFSAGIRF